MDTDVKSVTLTATGTMAAGPARVRKIAWVNTTSAGRIILKDGGSGGTTLVDLNLGLVAGYADCDLPANGVRFSTDVYLDLTNATSVTIFYG